MRAGAVGKARINPAPLREIVNKLGAARSRESTRCSAARPDSPPPYIPLAFPRAPLLCLSLPLSFLRRLSTFSSLCTAQHTHTIYIRQCASSAWRPHIFTPFRRCPGRTRAPAERMDSGWACDPRGRGSEREGTDRRGWYSVSRSGGERRKGELARRKRRRRRAHGRRHQHTAACVY